MPDFDKLDKAIHEKGRLAIMTLLATRWLVVSGSESGTENERRQSGDASAHLAQTRIRRGHEGNTRPSANEYALTAKGRTAFSDISRAGANRESGKKMKIFAHNFVSQSK